MKKQWLFLAVVVLMMLPLAAQSVPAKEEAATKALRGYKVDYSLVEMQDGKRVNARNYTMLVEEEERGNYSPGSIRVGTRVPVNMANKDGQPSTQYMDVGLNIDCRIKPRGADRASVESTIEVANFVSEDQMRSGAPVIRSNRSRVTAVVQLGKKTTVASYDDINSSRSTVVEVTVTQL